MQISYANNEINYKAKFSMFSKNFIGKVWATMCLTILLSCALYYPLLKRGEDKDFINVNLTRSAIQMVGSLLSQNLPYIPRNTLGRVRYKILKKRYMKYELLEGESPQGFLRA